MAFPWLLAAQAAQGILTGLQERSAARKQARVMEQNANAAIVQGEADAYAGARASRAQMGEMMAGAVEGGGLIGSGSIYDVLYQQSIENQMAAMIRRYEARSQAGAMRAQAGDMRKAGDNALVNRLFGTASSALASHVGQSAQGRLIDARARERDYFYGDNQPQSWTAEGGIPVPPRRIAMPRD